MRDPGLLVRPGETLVNTDIKYRKTVSTRFHEGSPAARIPGIDHNFCSILDIVNI